MRAHSFNPRYRKNKTIKRRRRARQQKGGFLGALAASIVAPMIFEQILK